MGGLVAAKGGFEEVEVGGGGIAVFAPEAEDELEIVSEGGGGGRGGGAVPAGGTGGPRRERAGAGGGGRRDTGGGDGGRWNGTLHTDRTFLGGGGGLFAVELADLAGRQFGGVEAEVVEVDGGVGDEAAGVVGAGNPEVRRGVVVKGARVGNIENLFTVEVETYMLVGVGADGMVPLAIVEVAGDFAAGLRLVGVTGANI